MGLGTIFGVHNPKTTKKIVLCKFTQPGLNRNSRGLGGIGLNEIQREEVMQYDMVHEAAQ